MIEAGVLLGLPRAIATELIVQTAVGSAMMLRDTGEHPVVLREQVTSPGGTTIAAIRELENHRVRAALLAAMEAARDRRRELRRRVLSGGSPLGRSRWAAGGVDGVVEFPRMDGIRTSGARCSDFPVRLFTPQSILAPPWANIPRDPPEEIGRSRSIGMW